MILLALVPVAAAHAQKLSPKLQNAVGRWQVIDDDSKPGGQVETYLQDGKLFGKVTQVRPERTPTDLCDRCSGANKNQLILGLAIIRDFHAEGDDWVGGSVLDPENGKVYRGKIWTVGRDELHLRGFIGSPIFGRTQTWIKLP